jgi:hypothetical protein
MASKDTKIEPKATIDPKVAASSAAACSGSATKRLGYCATMKKCRQVWNWPRSMLFALQKWKDGLPEETIILEPGQKFPDVEKMNEAAPKAEWVEGPDGKKRGPWQAQHVVYLLNLETMDRYSYPTGTVGGGIAVRELVDKTKWMRRLRGENVHPVVTLSDCFMNTRFGGRQRPSFTIKKWINLGDDKVLPTPSSSLESSAPPLVAHVGKELAEAKKPVETPTKKSARGARKVAGPALEEILNDDLPDSLK